MKSRIGAMVKKEFIQLSRDRRTLAMMILLPVIWLVAFGYAVSFDIDQIRVAVVDQAENEASRELWQELEAYEEFILTKLQMKSKPDKRCQRVTWMWSLFFRRLSVFPPGRK